MYMYRLYVENNWIHNFVIVVSLKYNNIIKIRSLTCSLLLTCGGVWDLRNTTYGLHATGTCGLDPMVPLIAPSPFFMNRNYCLIVFIVYISYSDTQEVAKCCVHEKKINVLRKRVRGNQRHYIGSCPQVPVWHASNLIYYPIKMAIARPSMCY